jgi:TPR repeat protein
MNSGQLISSLLLIVCLVISACAGSNPPIDEAVDSNDRPVYEAKIKMKELRKSAEAGDASAQNELGLLYYEGKAVPQDHRKAREWFDKAVKQGHAGAQVNLGTLYLHGEGAPQSSQMALLWFGQAAGQEDPLAFANLGLMYAQGYGVLQDFVQAHKWYNLSAAYGEGRAAEARDALAKQMTPTQIAEAQRQAREWTSREDKSQKTLD